MWVIWALAFFFFFGNAVTWNDNWFKTKCFISFSNQISPFFPHIPYFYVNYSGNSKLAGLLTEPSCAQWDPIVHHFPHWEAWFLNPLHLLAILTMSSLVFWQWYIGWSCRSVRITWYLALVVICLSSISLVLCRVDSSTRPIQDQWFVLVSCLSNPLPIFTVSFGKIYALEKQQNVIKKTKQTKLHS